MRKSEDINNWWFSVSTAGAGQTDVHVKMIGRAGVKVIWVRQKKCTR